MAVAVLSLAAASARAQPFEPLNVPLPGQVTVSPSLDKLNGPVDDFTVSPELTIADVALLSGGRFEFTGQMEGSENVTLEYCDADGTCDEVFYALNVAAAQPVTSSTITDTITVDGDVVTLCISTDELPGVPGSVENVCEGASGTYVDFDLSTGASCFATLKYSAVASGGADTACVVVCDDLGFCDTTTVIVATLEPDTYPELEAEFEIFVGESASVDIDVSAFSSAIAGVSNRCPDASGSAVDFAVDETTLTTAYYGLGVGEERACVVVTDEQGRTQLTTVTVRVLPRPALADTLRLRAGDEREYCFDGYRLETPAVTVADACPAGEASVAFAAGEGGCATFTGLAPGTREVCLVACEERGACDQVTLLIDVLAEDDERLPVANDDAYTVNLGEALQLDVLANDGNLGGVAAVAIVRPPAFGFAANANAQTLEYTREGQPCLVDTLVYEICNDFGCDRATVVLDAACTDRPPIETVLGFSPNGDGINDVFSVVNLEFYPDNFVQVYNRWGNRVFEQEGYANDWNGVYDGRELPDGTYFFVAEVEGEHIAGCVQLRR